MSYNLKRITNKRPPKKGQKPGVEVIAGMWEAHFMWSIPQRLLYLTNRFHVAERLFSNRSQMTSKMNKRVANEAIAECITDLTTF